MAPFGLVIFWGVFEENYCSSVYENFFEIFDILYGWDVFWIIVYYCNIVFEKLVFEKMTNPNGAFAFLQVYRSFIEYRE